MGSGRVSDEGINVALYQGDDSDHASGYKQRMPYQGVEIGVEYPIFKLNTEYQRICVGLMLDGRLVCIDTVRGSEEHISTRTLGRVPHRTTETPRLRPSIEQPWLFCAVCVGTGRWSSRISDTLVSRPRRVRSRAWINSSRYDGVLVSCCAPNVESLHRINATPRPSRFVYCIFLRSWTFSFGTSNSQPSTKRRFYRGRRRESP